MVSSLQGLRYTDTGIALSAFGRSVSSEWSSRGLRYGPPIALAAASWESTARIVTMDHLNGDYASFSCSGRTSMNPSRLDISLPFHFFVVCFLMGQVSGAAGSLWSLEELLPRPAIKSSSETLKTSQRRSRERTETPLPFSNPCQ